MKSRFLNAVAMPVIVVRHGLAVVLGFLGGILSSMGSSLSTASRKVDIW